ncbi:MAG: flippase [Balneolaceae bacterium]
MNHNTSDSAIGKSIAQNVSVLFGAQVVTWSSGFLLLYFLPRFLGTEDFGRLYLALSIKMMLGLLIDFGGNFLIPKEVARSRKKGLVLLSSFILLRIFLWILSIGMILLLSRILGYSEHVNLLILILAVAKLWEGGTTALSAFFQGIERMEYPSIGNIVEKIFVALVAVGALFLGADSIQIAVIMTVGALLNLLTLLWFSRRIVRVTYRFDPKIFSILRPAIPYFLFSLFSVIYYRIDALMLASLTTDEVTGWYGGAFRFFDMVMVLPLIYKTAVFPVFSKLWNNTQGVLENTIAHSLRLMILLGLPVTVLVFLFSGDIVQFFMGAEYAPSVIVLQIFALSIPIIYLDIILGSALMGAANKQKLWALTGLGAILLNISLNFLLIPWTQTEFGNGGIGAAATTLATELFVMSIAFILIPKTYLQTFRASYLVKPVIATLLMALPVLLLIHGTHLYWMLSFGLGVVTYLAMLLVIKTFDIHEIGLFKEFISERKERFLILVKS